MLAACAEPVDHAPVARDTEFIRRCIHSVSKRPKPFADSLAAIPSLQKQEDVRW
jgi:hypothetical protein